MAYLVQTTILQHCEELASGVAGVGAPDEIGGNVCRAGQDKDALNEKPRYAPGMRAESLRLAESRVSAFCVLVRGASLALSSPPGHIASWTDLT